MSSFFSHLPSKPQLLAKYVSLGTTLLRGTVSSLNHLARHLITVQGINPDTYEPGLQERQALLRAFNVQHLEDYDPGYGEWVQKQYQEYSDRGGKLSLDQFAKATDLNKVSDKTADTRTAESPAPTPSRGWKMVGRTIGEPKVGSPKSGTSSPADSSSDSQDHVSEYEKPLDDQAINDALQILAKYAVILRDPPEPLSSDPEAPTPDDKFRGSFRRAKDGQ